MIDKAAKKTFVIFILVLLTGLVLSAGAAFLLYDYANKQKTLAIERDVEFKAEHLQLRINSALKDLSATAALFYANESVSRKQFEEFVSINLSENSSTISLAWVPRITNANRAAFEEKLSGPGVRGYRIIEHNSHGLETTAFRQDVYYPVEYFISNVDGLLFPGLNMSGQYEIRRRIREANQRTEILVMQPVRTNLYPVDLISFQALLPLYEKHGVPDEQEPIGFILGQFDIKKLLAESFGEPTDLSLVLFDIDAPIKEQLLYINLLDKSIQAKINSLGDLAKLESLYWTRYFDVGDRKWLAAFIGAVVENNTRLNMLPYVGLLIGFLLTSLFSMYLLVAQMRRHKVEVLEQESHAKSRFFQALGHDLRQPLNSMRLYLSQYETEQQLEDAKLKSVFEKVRKNIDGLNDMFTSLLDITRLEAGAIKPEISVISLQQLITDLGDEYDIVAANKNLELNVDCPNVSVYSDKILLEHVLRNLLSNAIKYTSVGEVSLSVKQESQIIKVMVKDTGTGIANKDIQKVLQPYHRGKETKQIDGLGLGLAIVKQTCKLLEHDITIQSKLGKGTQVELTLKTAQPIDHKDSANKQDDLSSAKILLIDDELAIREELNTLLISWGCSVVPIASEQELSEVELCDINIIISDYHLGEENGVKLAQEIIERHSAKQALIVSADTSQELQRHCEEAGLHFLAKPLSPLKLKSLLHYFLHSPVSN